MTQFEYKSKQAMGKMMFPLMAVVVAMLVSGVLIKLIGLNPWTAVQALVNGSLTSRKAFGETVIKMTPLLFTGLSFALANRCGLINIGAEGQLYAGASCAVAVGLFVHGLPGPLHLFLTILAGFLGGGLLGVLAGFLKVRFGASEMITTIMLNYIAMHVTNFLISGPMIEPPGKLPQTAQLPATAQLPRIVTGTRIHFGIIIALFGVLFYYFYLWRTESGFKTRVVGMNPHAAVYAGISNNRQTLQAMFLAGAFAGLAGVCEIAGIQLRLYPNFSPNYGFDGIAVALLGQNSPAGILVSALLFGVLRAGSNRMQIDANVPNAMIYIIQSLIIMFVVGSSIFEDIHRKASIRKAAMEDRER